MSKTIIIINGPNLDRLGQREPSLYGTRTLEQLRHLTDETLKKYPVRTIWQHSHLEGELALFIHRAADEKADGIVINPGGLAHSSVVLHDAIKTFPGPVAEVHLTNTHARESFRRKKITARAATMVIEGTGEKTYILGVLGILETTLWNTKQQI